MRRILLATILVYVVLLLFSLSGCWWFEGLFPTPSPSPSSSPLPGNTDMDRKDFTLFLLDGGTLTLSSLKGKPVLLVFFSPGCSHCKEEVPALNEVYRKYKDTSGLVVLGAGYGLEASVREFVEKNGVQYPVGYFTDRSIVETYGFTRVPYNVFFSRDGDIVRTHVGSLSLSNLESYLSEILQ